MVSTGNLDPSHSYIPLECLKNYNQTKYEGNKYLQDFIEKLQMKFYSEEINLSEFFKNCDQRNKLKRQNFLTYFLRDHNPCQYCSRCIVADTQGGCGGLEGK